MTNEEKAKRIALDKQLGTSSGFLETYLIAYESAMSMAAWKDEQYANRQKLTDNYNFD